MKNQVAIITGASKGIGKSCAEYFLQNNWQVINLSRKPCTLTGVINISIDLASFENAALSHLPALLSAANKICLIHNAAQNKKDTIFNSSPADFREVIEINLIAPQRLNQIILPSMKKESSIIYIGSTLAEKAVPNAFSYVTSKHALAGMMRATCQDLSGTGIHTACICPGFTDTEMLRAHVQPEVLTLLAEKMCLKRLVQPQEIAELVFFCAIHPVMNGALLHANLGQME